MPANLVSEPRDERNRHWFGVTGFSRSLSNWTVLVNVLTILYKTWTSTSFLSLQFKLNIENVVAPPAPHTHTHTFAQFPRTFYYFFNVHRKGVLCRYTRYGARMGNSETFFSGAVFNITIHIRIQILSHENSLPGISTFLRIHTCNDALEFVACPRVTGALVFLTRAIISKR